MSVGRIFKGEQRRMTDPTSGREVLQLTNYLGHSYQFYFSDPCWLTDTRSLIFRSQRENADDYYRCDLDTGLITQLTDSSQPGGTRGCLSPIRNCLYFWLGNTLRELDLATLEDRPICEAPGTVEPGRPAASADGSHLFTLYVEPRESEGGRQAARDGGSRDLFENPPLTQIVRVNVETSRQEVLFEDRNYLSHLNPSPTRPELATFCHEGPWERVDQRIWGLDGNTNKVWPIRVQSDDHSVVAEHWLEDGERIGFRSHRRGTSGTRFGHIRYDNEVHVESDLTAYSRHFHTLDGSLVVSDGSPVYPLPDIVNRCQTWPYILLYSWTGEAYGDARILATHGSTFNVNEAHCHPHITPDGRHVLYTSDTTGYSNLYLVEIGDPLELLELNLDHT